MDVVVTGSAGFIGAALVRALRNRGERVRGLDLRGADIDADISAPGAWQDRLAGAEVVVHTAALVGMPSDAGRFWAVNTLGTRHVMDAALRAGARRFVLLSSVTVFGNDFPDQVTEEHPVRPTGVAYADSKIAAEHLVLDTHVRTGIETVVVRPADVYGPGSRPWTVLPVRMIASRRAAVPAKGIHSPLYVDDVVSGILAAVDSPAATGEILTLATGTGVGVGDYFDRYALMLGRHGVPRLPRPVLLAAAATQSGLAARLGRTVELSPAAVRYLADRRGTYSAAKAKRLLGWSARVDLDEGMERTHRWLRARGMLG